MGATREAGKQARGTSLHASERYILRAAVCKRCAESMPASVSARSAVSVYVQNSPPRLHGRSAAAHAQTRGGTRAEPQT